MKAEQRNFGIGCLRGLASRDARALALFGGFCLLFVLGWPDLVHRHLFKSGLYALCIGTSVTLFAFHASPPLPRPGLRWLARRGQLSDELYLSHMFVVLAAVALYRALLGKVPTWTFTVYLPVLVCCYGLALLLEAWPKVFSYRRFTDRKIRL
jgi:hypothetical protein